MFAYGALIDSSFAEQVQHVWRDFIGQLGGVHNYWFIIFLVVLVLFLKFLAIK